MKSSAPNPTQGPKRVASARRPRPRCRDCPFHAASGECLDLRIRSGRCGDQVRYLLPGGKRGHHLYVKPHDPKTPKQRYWRGRLGAASRSYSASLSEAQRKACIAAGAKRRSRQRLGQSGRLTGQQHWVGQECSRKQEPEVQSAARLTEALQTKGISQPTWDTHRGASVAAPGQHRGGSRQAKTGKGSPAAAVPLRRTGRKREACGRQKAQPSAKVTQTERLRRRTLRRSRPTPSERRWLADPGPWVVDWYSRTAARERGPPKAFSPRRGLGKAGIHQGESVTAGWLEPTSGLTRGLTLLPHGLR